MFKKIIKCSALISLVALGATSALANNGAMASFNSVYPANNYSCNACHTAAPALNNYGMAYKAIGGNSGGGTSVISAANVNAINSIAVQDVDNDGYLNSQEATVNTGMSDATASPYTIKAVVVNTDTQTTNAKVMGDAFATEAAFADPYAFIANGNEAMGNVALTITTVPADIYFLAGGAPLTATVHLLDVYSNTDPYSIAPVDWSINADGSIRIVNLPNGVASARYVVERTIPVNTAISNVINTYFPSGDNDSEGDEGNGNGAAGCMMGSPATPLMMVMSMLILGFFARRK